MFINEDFLIKNEVGKILYNKYVKDLPIIDYHCHLDPKEIYEDIHFKDLSQAWLGGDHYKWRLLRANGVTEDYVTGNKSNLDKFLKWSETVPYLIGSPLYHWTHMELKYSFNINKLLSPKTAIDIYSEANKKLDTLSARTFIKNSKVEVVCTTDDPVDDLNYRKSFWEGREDELRNVFKEIASLADVLICNEEDYQLALGISGPSIVGTNIKNEIDSFKELIDNVKKAYPNTSIYANTLRDFKSANEHLWGATILDGDDLIVIEPKEIQVLDRIGGGDGFVGGLLYGLLNEWEIEKCAQFAWASGALATSFDVDYATPIDEEQILNIWYGNARVSR